MSTNYCTLQPTTTTDSSTLYTFTIQLTYNPIMPCISYSQFSTRLCRSLDNLRKSAYAMVDMELANIIYNSGDYVFITQDYFSSTLDCNENTDRKKLNLVAFSNYESRSIVDGLSTFFRNKSYIEHAIKSVNISYKYVCKGNYLLTVSLLINRNDYISYQNCNRFTKSIVTNTIDEVYRFATHRIYITNNSSNAIDSRCGYQYVNLLNDTIIFLEEN